jgi:hypothetical protein
MRHRKRRRNDLPTVSIAAFPNLAAAECFSRPRPDIDAESGGGAADRGFFLYSLG